MKNSLANPRSHATEFDSIRFDRYLAAVPTPQTQHDLWIACFNFCSAFRRFSLPALWGHVERWNDRARQSWPLSTLESVLRRAMAFARKGQLRIRAPRASGNVPDPDLPRSPRPAPRPAPSRPSETLRALARRYLTPTRKTVTPAPDHEPIATFRQIFKQRNLFNFSLIRWIDRKNRLDSGRPKSIIGRMTC